MTHVRPMVLRDEAALGAAPAIQTSNQGEAGQVGGLSMRQSRTESKSPRIAGIGNGLAFAARWTSDNLGDIFIGPFRGNAAMARGLSVRALERRRRALVLRL